MRFHMCGNEKDVFNCRANGLRIRGCNHGNDYHCVDCSLERERNHGISIVRDKDALLARRPIEDLWIGRSLRQCILNPYQIKVRCPAQEAPHSGPVDVRVYRES